MLQFNVVWCIRSRREIVLTIQSDNGKQGYKVGRKKYRRPKVVLPRGPCERYSSDWIRRRDQSWARSVPLSIAAMQITRELAFHGCSSVVRYLDTEFTKRDDVIRWGSPISVAWWRSGNLGLSGPFLLYLICCNLVMLAHGDDETVFRIWIPNTSCSNLDDVFSISQMGSKSLRRWLLTLVAVPVKLVWRVKWNWSDRAEIWYCAVSPLALHSLRPAWLRFYHDKGTCRKSAGCFGSLCCLAKPTVTDFISRWRKWILYM